MNVNILLKQNKPEDGTLCRTFPETMTVWGDDLYISIPFEVMKLVKEK